MPIIKNGKTVNAIYKGNKPIVKIFKGLQVVWEAFKKLLVSGIPPLRLNNSVGENLENYKIDGNSTQEAEPTPSNPKEIKSVGDKTKNLVNIDEGLNDCFVKNEDGSYTLTKTSSNRYTNNIVLNIPANTTFSVQTTVLEYTGSYSQCLQIVARLEDGSSKYINSDNFNTLKTNKYDKAVVSIWIYSDNANAIGSLVTFKDFMVTLGDTKQNYEPFGYKIPVISRSKNLIDYREFKSRNQSSYPLTINNDGSLEYNGDYYIKIDVSHLQSGKTYFLNMKYTFNGELITVKQGIYRFLYEDGSMTSGCYFGATLATDATKKIKEMYCYFIVGSTEKYIAKAWDIILTEGNTIEEYEPYIEPTKTNIYLKEPIRKIGDYSDYIDFENKKVVRNIYEYKITGNEQYYLCDTDSIRTQFGLIPQIKRITSASSLFIGYLCSHNPFIEKSYEYLTTYSAQDPTSFEFRKIVNNWEISEYTVNAWKTFVQAEVTKGTPVTIDYVIETPAEEPIELPEIPTIKGTTILEIETEIEPSNMEVIYKGKG